MDKSKKKIEKKPKFFIENNCTFFKKKSKGEKTTFVDGVLKILGRLDEESCYICSFKSKNEHFEYETRIITMNYESFRNPNKFSGQLQLQFGDIIVGSVTKDDIILFQTHLKEEYINAGQPRLFRLPQTVGYMGDGYWYLSQSTQIRYGKSVPPDQIKYFDKDSKLKNCSLEIKSPLLDLQKCIRVNRKIIRESCSFGINTDTFRNALSFCLSRLLLLSQNDTSSFQSGEANILLLFGDKNVGKSLTQYIIHFGQGGTKLKHDLLISGGNSTTSGTSNALTLDVCGQTTMIVNINDIWLNDSQADNLLQINEKLKQGSIKRGLKTAQCCGIVMSSNLKEPDRISGRVIRLEYSREILSRENLDNLEKLRSICEKYKGFLLSWVVHFGHIWKNHAKESKLLAEILMKNFRNRQQRWCDGVALLYYTKYMYLQSLGIEISLKDQIEEFLINNQEESIYQRVENNIRLKISQRKCHVLSWLNWVSSLVLKDKRKVKAISIKVSTFNDEFLDIGREEVEEHLEKLSEHAVGARIYFCNDGENCTIAQQKARGKDTSQISAFKFPLDQFSSELNAWFQNGNFDAEVQPISDADHTLDIGGLLEIEDLLGLNNWEDMDSSSETSSEASSSEDLADGNVNTDPNIDLSLLTPTKRGDVELRSHASQSNFMEGVRYGMRLQQNISINDQNVRPQVDADIVRAEDVHEVTLEEAKEASAVKKTPHLEDDLPHTEGVACEGSARSTTDEDVLIGSGDEPSSEKVFVKLAASCKNVIKSDKIVVMKSGNDDQPQTSGLDTTQDTPDQVEEKSAAVDKAKKVFPDGVFGAFRRETSVPTVEEAATIGSEIDNPGVNIYCHCKRAHKRKLIECSGEKCPGNNWFHMKCVGMRRQPPVKQLWYCDSCAGES